MHFTLLVQGNSSESWKDKLLLDGNISTGIAAENLNVPIKHSQVDSSEPGNQRPKHLIAIRCQNFTAIL